MKSLSSFFLLILLFGLAFLSDGCTGDKPSVKKESGLTLHAIEELRIGKLNGEGEYIFGNINHVSVGTKGQIFVADTQIPIIRMYDKKGEFIRNVGREGKGPGEYLYLGGMRTFPDGRLATWDQNNARINVYDEKGDYVVSHFVKAGLFSADVFEVGHDGNFYVRTTIGNTSDGSNWEYGWLKINPKGELIDTIKVPLDNEVRELTFVLFTASGDAHVFVEWHLSSMSPLGYLITGSNDDEYSFELNLPDSSQQIIERNYTPVKVKPEEKKQWESFIRSYGVNNIVPETKPAYKKILTDMQGRIWIYRYVEAVYTEENIYDSHNWWEPPTYDVFLPDGSFYATVILPLNANFRDAKNDQVWAIVQGELDEQYVVRFRLEELNDSG
ncbi:MAG: 6-bladed beta-propeller [Balneolaceae bacterium]